MPKFRTIPIYVEAERWFPGRRIAGVVEKDVPVGSSYTHAYLESGSVIERVTSGDWIVTVVGGAKKVLPDVLFRQIYEEVFEPTDVAINVQSY